MRKITFDVWDNPKLENPSMVALHAAIDLLNGGKPADAADRFNEFVALEDAKAVIQSESPLPQYLPRKVTVEELPFAPEGVNRYSVVAECEVL